MASVGKVHFNFMPEYGTIDAVVILKMLQELCQDKEKILYVFYGIGESFLTDYLGALQDLA